MKTKQIIIALALEQAQRTSAELARVGAPTTHMDNHVTFLLKLAQRANTVPARPS